METMRNIVIILSFATACCLAVSATAVERDSPLAAKDAFLMRSDPVPSTTLCQPDEQVIFSCDLKGSGKYVSLCGSKNLTREEGYLQYRFGRPGAVELEFPKDKDSTKKQFTYDHYFRALVDRTNISFVNGGYTYTVFDDYEGDVKPEIREAGVKVERSGKDTTMRCKGRAMANYQGLDEILINRNSTEGNPDD
jgi:hypothetical protein